MTDSREPMPLPGRGEIFTDAGAKAVWAAIITLPDAEQHKILGELRARLACIEGTTTHETRVRHAVSCLREAAADLGHSPSVAEYRELREANPHRGWAADGTLRSWLGGSWNDCLRAARLDTVADGDVLVAQLGPALSENEVCEALRQCAKELGDIPTLNQYYGWARRADVRARPGRRPLSNTPFVRLFGGYLQALEVADLVGESATGVAKRSTLQRHATYRVTTERVRDAILAVAATLGRSPRVHEYNRGREQIMREALEAGQPVALPAHSTIQQHYPVWDDALAAAGLEPLGGRKTGRLGKKFTVGPRPRISDEQLKATLREAHGSIGDPFTSSAFKEWRKAQKLRDRTDGRFRRIPSYDLFYTRFGTWDAAVQAALSSGGEDAVAA